MVEEAVETLSTRIAALEAHLRRMASEK
jgi:hypothetical protein